MPLDNKIKTMNQCYSTAVLRRLEVNQKESIANSSGKEKCKWRKEGGRGKEGQEKKEREKRTDNYTTILRRGIEEIREIGN